MSNDHGTHHAEGHGGHGTFGSLMTGFAMAVILTVLPFGLVMGDTGLSREVLIGLIMGMGGLQIIVHLVYFLHVNKNVEQGWTLVATIFSVIILVIVLIGSLWVMHNMNQNMMPMPDMDEMMSLQSQQG
ncbi:cytochrome o ubiquinol oxidase subunit IV [Pseudooceanicola marinus]|uniref:cytochrome o ubiquinol oxidase subunit IV n=1 Tax=Pseudooceanicola marinus TaxID=396013 RepID=UPI001CD58828|nr:cytochrome o ubiquinol oxidase subunit IV [Pseudooceanicola marinus]MCA1336616.1 cytochrome o ubiquinol oxidase subunit IV [Pseudooceanicola marinus]